MCANAGCGANAEKACPRCMTTYYCSHGCQKANWPGHKLRCVLFADTAAGARFVEIDLRRMPELPEGFVMTSFSMQAGTGNLGAENAQECVANNLRKKVNSLFVVKVQVCACWSLLRMCALTHCMSSAPLSSLRVRKKGSRLDMSSVFAKNNVHWQVPLQVQLEFRGDCRCMVYDRNRELSLFTSHELTTPAAASAKHEGLEAMCQLVHRKGVQGAKAYFQAYVTPQKKLRILLSSMVSPPGW